MANSYGMGRTAAGAVGSEESAGKMTEAPAEDAPMAGFKTTSVSFRLAENGGVIATCSKEKQGKRGKDENYDDRYKSKDYAFSSVEEAAAFLRTELASGAASATHGAATVAPPGMRG